MRQLHTHHWCLFFLLLGISFSLPVYAQTQLTCSNQGTYYLVERSDISRYDNGKYSGLTRREVRSYIAPALSGVPSFAPQITAVKQRNPGGTLFNGSFYVLEETVKNNESTIKGISESIPSVFYIARDGSVSMIQDLGFPSYRSFPAYPVAAVQPGSVWQCAAERAVDPLNSGIITRLNIYVQYTFKGEETYKGKAVYRIAAKWATRYGGSSRDIHGDPDLQSATGTHDADILVLKETGAAMLIRDRMDETFTYKSGATVRLKGVTLLFTEFPPAQNKNDVMTIMRGIARGDSTPVPSDTVLQGSGGTSQNGSNTLHDGNGIPQTETPAVAMAPHSESGSSGIPGIHGDEKPGGTGSVNDSGNGERRNKKTPPPVVVEETDNGVRLSVRNLQFRPDSDMLLPSEMARIDEIADMLKTVPEAMFLVEGHSAPTGRPEGEQRLSEERAKRIAAELSQRGIKPDRFICAGRGSTRPLSTGSTESDRAQNRRVEITILM